MCTGWYICSLYRWDLQRARALLEHQELLKKYNKKSGGAESAAEKKDKIVSFLPKLDESMCFYMYKCTCITVQITCTCYTVVHASINVCVVYCINPLATVVSLLYVFLMIYTS